MFISDLTKYELERFKAYRKNNTCPICGKVVDFNDGFEMLKVKYAANTYHAFIHTNCILSKVSRRYQNGKKSSES